VFTKTEPSVPLQELGSVGVNVITGVGFMDIVKVKGALVHPFRVAVAEIVPVIALAVLLDSKLNGVICPFPEAPRPIVALELLQVKVAPAGTLTKSAGSAEDTGHPLTSLMVLIVGVGRIVMVNVEVDPVHPLRVGVTDTVPTTFEFVIFAGAL
jgi:hypothetical protein